MSRKSVFIVEDDPHIADLIKLYTEKEGWSSVISYGGKEALSLLQTVHPDLIVLDIMLPDLDGIEVLKQIRKQDSVTPVFFLTAKSEEIDRILGLELGADDYITKPFSPKELIARMKAIFRRMQTSDGQIHTTIHIRDLELDSLKMEVKVKGNQIRLSGLEFALLFFLASHPGQVFNRNQLMDNMYPDHDVLVIDRTVDVHIKNLRKKLNDPAKNPKYIESVFGIGYRFIES
jgi:two-component system alkaline phosphatase synthesis response regulator PhoP